MQHSATRAAIIFKPARSNSQAFAAFSTSRVDHCTAATGFHADQKAMGTGAAGF